MPRVCTICTHPQRSEIDAALVAGEPLRVIARRFATSPDALRRHKRDHLSERLSMAAEAVEIAQADDLLAQVQSLHGRTLNVLKGAEGTGDGRLALMAIREARGNLELLGKLMGQLNERATINVLLAPEWQMVQAVLMAALGPYPEARAAVAGSLKQIGSGAE